MWHLRSALGRGQCPALWLPRYILAIAIAYGTGFCYLAGELSAFKTQFDPFVERASRYFAELIVPGNTTLFFVRTDTFDHARAFFTSDSTYAYFHGVAP